MPAFGRFMQLGLERQQLGKWKGEEEEWEWEGVRQQPRVMGCHSTIRKARQAWHMRVQGMCGKNSCTIYYI